MKSMLLKISLLAIMILIASLAQAEKGGRKKHGNDRWSQANQGYGYSQEYDNAGYGLPPGLAKKDHLPPGLQKHLWKRGSLPPGLQKRLGPGPMYYAPYQDRCLPPAYYYVPKRPRVRVIIDF